MTTTFTWHVPADHPAFAGHFPAHPILPGVALLGWAIHALGETLGAPLAECEVAQAKFLHPVGPDSGLQLSLADTPGGWRFEIQMGSTMVATGVLRIPAR